MKDQIICFIICIIVCPGLFMVHAAGAIMIKSGNVSLVSLSAMIAPVILGGLLHIVYPLSKVDRILSEAE